MKDAVWYKFINSSLLTSRTVWEKVDYTEGRLFKFASYSTFHSRKKKKEESIPREENNNFLLWFGLSREAVNLNLASVIQGIIDFLFVMPNRQLFPSFFHSFFFFNIIFFSKSEIGTGSLLKTQ